MASPASEKIWTEVGRSTTTERSNRVRKEVELDDYYVVIGFEVNNVDAFKDNIQDLAVDYGHAFFYIVKNKAVGKWFSFGPAAPGKNGWFDKGDRIGQNAYNSGAAIKDGYKNARPGNADYKISETVKAFKIVLTQKQGKDLEAETDAVRKDVRDGKQQYTAYMNDTCAETARDILTKANIPTPEGSGKIKHSGIAPFSVAYAVNPYMWHHNFKKSGSVEASMLLERGMVWLPPFGQADPLFGSGK
jgi:hypothetical protein